MATGARYPRRSWLAASAALGLLVVAAGGGCNFGESGIAPPTDRIFLPDGLTIDPDDTFLYVVNSNADLRYNAGTIVAVDLAQVALVRACAQDPGRPECGAGGAPPLGNYAVCPKTRFTLDEPVPGDYCCVAADDVNLLNCNEPQFIRDKATVQIGSFAGAVALLPFERNGVQVRRLFTTVRAEPSITFADATVSGGELSMRCTGDPADPTPPPLNAFCDDNWRIRRPGGATAGQLTLSEEPHTLWLDPADRALFVGHLTVTTVAQLLQGGGISSLDLCNLEHGKPVAFAGLAATPFLPATLSQAVATLSGPAPAPTQALPGGLRAPVVYATARYSTAIGGMAFRNPQAAVCDNSDENPSPEPRDLTLVAAQSFYAPSFLPYGNDVRGILFSADGSRAFVLHRNDSDAATNPLDATAILNPAAIEVLDLSPLADGVTPSYAPLAEIEVCNGPTAMQMHGSGANLRIYVTCYDDGQIYVVDPVALVVTAIIEVDTGPTNLVFANHDPNTAYIASYANSHLSVIDIGPGSVTEDRVVLRIGLPHPYGQ